MMREENKRTEPAKKVVELNIDETVLKDPEIDRLLKESIKKEADRIEERLNRNPKLKDIEAPAGMFASIVARLKAAGIWEEEMEAEVKKKHIYLKAHAENEEVLLKTGTDGRQISSESVYAMLSEADRHALELGWEVEKKNQKREERKKKRRKALKYSGTTAAVLVAVFGISMTSEANRHLVQNVWNGIANNVGFRIETNYPKKENELRSKTEKEIKAMEDIYKQLGIPTIDFSYLPQGMEYQNYEIMDGFLEAKMYYSYEEKLFSETILSVDKESVSYYFVDSGAVLQDTVQNRQDITVEIWEINLGEDEETYAADFIINNRRYVLNGVIPLEEMKKIVKYMIIL